MIHPAEPLTSWTNLTRISSVGQTGPSFKKKINLRIIRTELNQLR